MRFGVCADLAKIKEIEELGYDYFDVKLNSLATMEEEQFNALKDEALKSSLKIEASSLLFPKTMMLIKEGGDEELEGYLDVAFSRMKALGCTLSVFGSGKSRYVPEGMSWINAYRILVHKTKIIAKKAEEYGVRVAIEPLNRNETNLINSLAEGSALVSDVDNPSIGLLADMYHMAVENEDMTRLEIMGPFMHTHVALKENRWYPEHETEELKSFFCHLKASGYDGRMSIEGKCEDMKASSLKSLELLRKLDKE